MLLEDIKKKSIYIDNSLRIAIRLNLSDLNSFKKKISKCNTKLFFENCINDFYKIEEFKNVKNFYYKYTKDKSYTFSLDPIYKDKLMILSKELNLNYSDVLRFIILTTINKK